MNYDLSELSDFDIFFFYGEPESNLEQEIQSDIMAGVMQAKRSLFYNRLEGAGLTEKENHPNGLILSILTKYDIAQWGAYRNTQVSDGVDGKPDRRVAISQSSVEILKNEKGELSVDISYIPFTDFKQTSTVSLPILRGA